MQKLCEYEGDFSPSGLQTLLSRKRSNDEKKKKAQKVPEMSSKQESKQARKGKKKKNNHSVLANPVYTQRAGGSEAPPGVGRCTTSISL